MEGSFWRATDVARRRAPVVPRGVNRHPDGDWATVAVAGHPGGSVRSVVLPGAHSAPGSPHVSAGGGAFDASDAGLHVDLGDGARAAPISNTDLGRPTTAQSWATRRPISRRPSRVAKPDPHRPCSHQITGDEAGQQQFQRAGLSELLELHVVECQV